jgi:hypothetical protein
MYWSIFDLSFLLTIKMCSSGAVLLRVRGKKNRDIMLTWSKQDVMLSKIPTREVSQEHNFKSQC